MSLVRLWILAFLIFGFAQAALAKDVSVSGYYRKNGTYVQPYHRSAPDGDFSNNWSTRGNINPYTGQMGTKDYPSTGYGGDGSANSLSNTNNWGSGYAQPSSGASLGSQYAAPFSSAASMPVSAPSGSLSPSGGIDTTERMNVGNRLTNMGYNVDWSKHSLAQMQDLETRIGISKRLLSMGEDVPWQHKSLPELLDMQSRVEASKRLQHMGQTVDWKTHSLGEMLNLEAGAGR